MTALRILLIIAAAWLSIAIVAFVGIKLACWLPTIIDNRRLTKALRNKASAEMTRVNCTDGARLSWVEERHFRIIEKHYEESL